MKKFQKVEFDKKSAYQRIFLGILIFFAFVLVVLRVGMANTLVDQSLEVSKIERQTNIVMNETEKTNEAIRSLSSIKSVSQRALEAGFVKMSTYSYLTKPQTVAERIDLSSR